jgi:hypothetical protein
VTDAGQATVPEAMEFAGRPDVLERASQSEETKLYRFAVEEQSGLKHLGLPPAFENE